MRLDVHGEPLLLNIGVFLGFENTYGVRKKYECMLKQKCKGPQKRTARESYIAERFLTEVYFTGQGRD